MCHIIPNYFRLIFFPLFLSVFSAAAQHLSTDTIQQIKDASVYLQITRVFPIGEAEYPSSGSGFFIDSSGLVATNYHVVQPVIRSHGFYFPAEIKEIKAVMKSGTKEYAALDAHLVSIDKENDLAILALDTDEKTPYLAFENNKLIEATKVWVFGYPFGEAFGVIQRGPEITISNGFITALRHDDKEVLQTIQFDAVVKPGNSGGPVMNQHGKVIGIASMMYDGTSRMNFAVPVHYLQKLVQETKVCDKETVKVEIATQPGGADIYINRVHYDKTPVELEIPRSGLQTIQMLNRGYYPVLMQKSMLCDFSIKKTLEQVQPLVIQTGVMKKIPDIEQFLKKGINREDVLMQENFENAETFNTWNQNTGGTGSRTWFLEDNLLKQYEDDEMLHAITFGDSTWRNYYLEAKVKITGGENDSRAGLIFRETENGFYLFRIHRDSDKAQLAYHCKKPFGWFVIMEKKLDKNILEDTWYSLSVSAYDEMITCSIDGNNIFTTSAKYTHEGKIGCYSVESKASFDSLIVYGMNNIEPGEKQKPEQKIKSFWFSDYFSYESGWWYQYKDSENQPSPMNYSDAGLYYDNNDSTGKQYCEFAKYLLADFYMDAIMTLGEETSSGVFEIFFRKTSRGCYLIRFDPDEEKLLLISIQDGKEKILKKEKLESGVFDKSFRVMLVIKGNKVETAFGMGSAIEFKTKKFEKAFGTFGFAVKNAPLILHQMTVGSVGETESK